MDQPSDLGHGCLQFGAQFVSGGGRAIGIARDLGTQNSCLDCQGGELGAKAIVQVAAQATALLLTGGDQALAGALQVGGEADGMGGDACLPGKIGQQAAVGGAKGLPGERGATTNSPIGSDW